MSSKCGGSPPLLPVLLLLLPVLPPLLLLLPLLLLPLLLPPWLLPQKTRGGRPAADTACAQNKWGSRPSDTRLFIDTGYAIVC